MTQNKVRIYGCGGFGINILQNYMRLSNGEQGGNFAGIDPALVDTSRSNLTAGVDEDTVFIFKNDKGQELDGGGKDRKLNAEAIVNQTPSVLQKFPPGVFNIVIHGASGASGSTAGPSIVSELKNRKIPVVSIIVASTDTVEETTNTFKVIETYDKIAKARGSSTVIHYIENTMRGRSEADTSAMYVIGLLLGLWSGKHRELDSADLKNFFGYADKIAKPTIANLSIFTDVGEIKSISKLISVATIAGTGMETRIDPIPPYQAVGFAPDEWRSGHQNSLNLIGDEPINFCLSFDFLSNRYAELKTICEDNLQRMSALTSSNAKFGGEADTDSGLVL